MNSGKQTTHLLNANVEHVYTLQPLCHFSFLFFDLWHYHQSARGWDCEKAYWNAQKRQQQIEGSRLNKQKLNKFLTQIIWRYSWNHYFGSEGFMSFTFFMRGSLSFWKSLFQVDLLQNFSRLTLHTANSNVDFFPWSMHEVPFRLVLCAVRC